MISKSSTVLWPGLQRRAERTMMLGSNDFGTYSDILKSFCGSNLCTKKGPSADVTSSRTFKRSLLQLQHAYKCLISLWRIVGKFVGKQPNSSRYRSDHIEALLFIAQSPRGDVMTHISRR